MKKLYTIICFILALSLSQNSWAQFDQNDYLKADGTVLRNEAGQGDVVSLRGTNLGSWLSMEYWIGPLSYGAVVASTWESYADSVSDENLSYILDGDATTIWSSDSIQNADKNQQVIFDCQKTIVFNKILLNSGTDSQYWPTGYSIEISTDSATWTRVSSGTVSEAETAIYTDLIQCRYFRICQTGTSTEPWHIAEFDFLCNDDYTVRNATYDRFGVEKADALWDYYQNLWITSEDLDSIKSMGMNMVRVPFYWMEVMNNDGTMKSYAFKQLDWVVEECSQREIYVILDLHGAPGGLDGYITSGQATTNELWNDTVSQRMTVDIWKAITLHYKDEPAVAAFDLMNEPVSNNSDFSTSDMYDKIYQAIRPLDANRVLCVQAFWSFDMIDSPDARGWENMLYQGHYYNEDYDNWTSINATTNYAIGNMAYYSQAWDVPVLAGEYNQWMHWDLWSKLMNGFNSCNVSWCNWTYKNNTGSKNWGLYLSNSSAQPDMSFDDSTTIKAKWDAFTTDNFYYNKRLIDTVATYTQDTAFRPVGQTIWIQAYDDTYISSEDGEAEMTCNTSTIDESCYFEVEDAGDGKIALKGSNGKYVSSNYGNSAMTCDADAIGETEMYYWVNLEDGQIALVGKGGFVCMEGGSSPINCNRTAFDGWEMFAYGTEEDLVDVVDAVPGTEQGFYIYPNPLNSVKILAYQLTDNSLQTARVYNLEGKLLKEVAISGKGEINLSELSAGIYLFQIGTQKEKLIIP